MNIYEKLMRCKFEKPISKARVIKRWQWYSGWMKKHSSKIALKGEVNEQRRIRTKILKL